MASEYEEDLSYDSDLIRELDEWIQPMKRLMSPVSIGIEHVPREGPVLLTGNHTIYGVLDIPMLGLEVWEKTGRAVRALGDHIHFKLPVWRDVLRSVGAVRGTRELCGRLFEMEEAVLVFPGGGREVMKHKHEQYRLIWKERIGFARMAIEYGVPIVPFASVGVEDMFDVVLDADDLMQSPLGKLLHALRIDEQPWFRRGELIPPIAKGHGLGPLPRLERQYFLFGGPIDTAPYAGLHDDRDACYEVRNRVKSAIEHQIEQLRTVRAADPERYPVQRLLRAVSRKLG